MPQLQRHAARENTGTIISTHPVAVHGGPVLLSSHPPPPNAEAGL
jgi:hypothetical protein